MNKNISLFIIDDDIPMPLEFIAQSVDQSKITAEQLKTAVTSQWKGDHNLRKLISDLTDSEAAKLGSLEIFGFRHPELAIQEIGEGLVPDVIIYDWEYGSESYQKSKEWLLDLLQTTNAFIFVYSDNKYKLPPFLNKEEFTEFAPRFQLFLKGNATDYVFSSEDFLYQYILSRINKNTNIKIQSVDVKFESNGYLKEPADILYLESIFGREKLLEEIGKVGNKISEKSIETMVEDIHGELLFNRERGFLVDPNNQAFVETFKPTEKISFQQVLREFGLESLREVCDIGFVRILKS